MSANREKCPKLAEYKVGLNQAGFYFGSEGKTGMGKLSIDERNFIKSLCLECPDPDRCVYDYTTVKKGGSY